MQTSSLTVIDLDMKAGVGKKGPWTLCTLTGSDREKYKTFDETLIAQLRQAHASGTLLEITWQADTRIGIDRNGQRQEYLDRDIKAVAIPQASAAPQQGAPQAKRVQAAPKIDKMPPAYWEGKDRLEFQRMAHMSALKACSDVMAACIHANVESYKFQDAVQLVKVEAAKLYAGYFKVYEGGADHGDDAEVITSAEYDSAINE